MDSTTHDIDLQVAGDYLRVLFPHLPPGYIETRLIVEGASRLVHRQFYESSDQLLGELGELDRIAAEHGAGVFLGVLPRRDSSSGKAKNTLPGKAAWADIDFKDFPGGEGEARARLEEFRIRPSIIVRSGHGLHVYWLLREPADPQELQALSRALARVLGADHAYDAARLLRLPGTWNRKDSDDPVQTTIELLEPDLLYSVSDFEEVVEIKPPGRAAPEIDPVEIADELPPKIKALIHKHKRIASLFNGEGKPEHGLDGTRLDASASGYDFSFLRVLVKAGVTDPNDLATALACRPGGEARSKGPDYIQRTVEKVLGLHAEAQEALLEDLNFEVERVRVFDSNPARYELTIDGVQVVMGSGDLWNKTKFALAFMDALRLAPKLPDREQWVALVNTWLGDAEVVSTGPDGNTEAVLREAVAHVIKDLPSGAQAADLDRGMAVALSSGLAFRADAVLDRLREIGHETERSDLCRILNDLGYHSHSARIGDATARVWRRRA